MKSRGNDYKSPTIGEVKCKVVKTTLKNIRNIAKNHISDKFINSFGSEFHLQSVWMKIRIFKDNFISYLWKITKFGVSSLHCYSFKYFVMFAKIYIVFIPFFYEIKTLNFISNACKDINTFILKQRDEKFQYEQLYFQFIKLPSLFKTN